MYDMKKWYPKVLRHHSLSCIYFKYYVNSLSSLFVEKYFTSVRPVIKNYQYVRDPT